MSRRCRCVTRQCGNAVDVDPTTLEQGEHGHWQFHCPRCRFWNLCARDGAVQATSATAFDLARLPPDLRLSGTVKRSPSGGI